MSEYKVYSKSKVIKVVIPDEESYTVEITPDTKLTDLLKEHLGDLTSTLCCHPYIKLKNRHNEEIMFSNPIHKYWKNGENNPMLILCEYKKLNIYEYMT